MVGAVAVVAPAPVLTASGTPVVVGQVAAVTPVPTLQAAGSAGAQLRVRVVTRLENAAPSRAVVAGGNTGVELPARATSLVLEETDG